MEDQAQSLKIYTKTRKIRDFGFYLKLNGFIDLVFGVRFEIEGLELQGSRVLDESPKKMGERFRKMVGKLPFSVFNRGLFGHESGLAKHAP